MIVPRFLLALTTLFLVLALGNVLAGEVPSTDQLRDRATAFVRPRLLLRGGLAPGELQARFAGDPLLSRASERLLQTATAMAGLPPVERVMRGKRMLGSSRLALRRILTAGLAFRLTGDPAHAALARREMLAAAAFKDWNPSHFLDVAEMCAALAIGYDWFYDTLTPAQRDRIAAALIDKGLRAVPRGAWWLKTTNNWNQVCHGGLALAAIAVWEREPELSARTLHRALQRVPRSMVLYAPDGAYPEGPTYWRYGTAYNVLLIESLRTAFGDDLGLSDHRGFMRSADFYLHSTGTGGGFFNYGDANIKKSWRPSPSMFWFARVLERPSLLWRERDLLARTCEQPIDATSNDLRFLPLLLLWAPQLSSITAPEATAYTADGETPVSFQRGGWTDPDAAFFGLKGGSAGYEHAHMDIGSFVYDRFGQRWGIDLGKVSYGAVEGHGVNIWDRSQKGGRWRIARHINQYHSTLVVDDRAQRVSGHAPIVRHGHSAGAGFAIVDLQPTYAGCLAAASRGLRLAADGDLLIQDELRADDQARSVRWGMMTRAAINIDTPTIARLDQGEATVYAVIEHPAGAGWTVIDRSEPRLPFEPANPDARLLAFTHQLAAGADARLVVRLLAAPPSEGPAPVRALETW